MQVDAGLRERAGQQVVERRADGDHRHVAQLFENAPQPDAGAELRRHVGLDEAGHVVDEHDAQQHEQRRSQRAEIRDDRSARRRNARLP